MERRPEQPALPLVAAQCPVAVASFADAVFLRGARQAAGLGLEDEEVVAARDAREQTPPAL